MQRSLPEEGEEARRVLDRLKLTRFAEEFAHTIYNLYISFARLKLTRFAEEFVWDAVPDLHRAKSRLKLTRFAEEFASAHAA